jgi:hypothetical protein
LIAVGGGGDAGSWFLERKGLFTTKRNGTTTLFAAQNVAIGEVYGLCQQKHRHQEWLRFLRMIDQTVPTGKGEYLTATASAQKSPSALAVERK